MIIILEEKEIISAVKEFVGKDYNVKEVKITSGRTSGNRIELEVEKLNKVIEKTQDVVLNCSSTENQAESEKEDTNKPIFTKL